ncbi:bifunctional tetrahydrofolate synthase/dihydrofolate synthase [Lysobacter pythonis]|uniref:Dihydrofolate synthase/folylpolyglutamate synthase n=1 Tax=Solilutibacter pythonis TaxID=2483112 RepID=A0A3M2HV01_9GAMM|nr:bifunctional tetrahydrofolate synthase/dihydrofolate synthase [Lysobacter pythonis]RMH93551.1 bifunctional tetrahydrofolate synthase/dihydrofolate synthase [Lysobacter pythonis]
MENTLADWLARLEKQHPVAIELGLARVREVAGRMRLAKPARQVVSVAGTNGKGSTVAFIEAIARAAGWRVGSYTSPHLLRYNERVRIDGREATDAELVAAFEAVEAARGDVSLTYFEAGTLAALWLFAHVALDLAILEVGLGGRLDAVNIIDADCAVITTVDLDHQDWLGEDIETIGFEKAGIARAWKPLVLGDDDPPASVLRHAYALGASSWRIASDFFAEPIDDGHWRWREVGAGMILPMPALAAPVQLRNAACAIAALRAIGFDAGEATWARGIAEARIAARLQAFDVEGVELRVDVGHNPQAARALAEALRALPPKRTLAVYAALGDKDAVGVTEALRAAVDGWIIAGSTAAGPRGVSAGAVAGGLPAGLPVLAVAADVDAGIEHALAATESGQRVLVFGGFHAAECVLKRFAGSRGAKASRL